MNTNITASIEKVLIGKNTMAKLTVIINGKTYEEFSHVGRYNYNQIDSETNMFISVWCRAATVDEIFRSMYVDCYDFILDISSKTFRKAA